MSPVERKALRGPELLLLIPIYDDWQAVSALMEQLGALRLPAGARLSALLIDDGSIQPMPAGLRARHGAALKSFSVLRLARNVGHQAAIAVGMSQVAAGPQRYDAVLVMDGDGEDAPADVLKLIAAWEAVGRAKAVFAHRARRSEGLLFRLFYTLYRLSYRAFTGTWISMGNFSLLPWAHLQQLVLYPELWRHYPATVKKSKLPVALLPTDRAQRLGGRSKMNFYNLVVHGLGAITVHSDIVGVRALSAVAALVLLCAAALLGLGCTWAFTSIQVPAWASNALIALSVVALQFLVGALVFSFLTLSGRSPLALNPAQNYQGFVKSRTKIYG